MELDKLLPSREQKCAQHLSFSLKCFSWIGSHTVGGCPGKAEHWRGICLFLFWSRAWPDPLKRKREIWAECYEPGLLFMLDIFQNCLWLYCDCIGIKLYILTAICKNNIDLSPRLKEPRSSLLFVLLVDNERKTHSGRMDQIQRLSPDREGWVFIRLRSGKLGPFTAAAHGVLPSYTPKRHKVGLQDVPAKCPLEKEWNNLPHVRSL